ncbi:MAG TPA: ABC transporter substrate-binding protein [Devosia sp.]|jgi:alpha-glucoside transport system substrate-binding protein|nr:ABC transporter substrate-binding protein [Devosia sp.]
MIKRTLALGVSLITIGLIAAPALGQAMPQELADAMAGKYKGKVVTAFGAFADADEVKFNQDVKAFEDATGIDIQYESSKQFEATIGTRVDAGNVPDLADFPQPGLMGIFAKQGKLIDLTSFMTPDYLKGQYLQSWLDMGTKPGADGKPTMVGLWERVNVKSLVWYPKKAFDAAGYKVPTTWDELKKLQDQIVADGDTPWCIGIESGAATGWAATDWIEEVMLRTTSLENYDKWTTGALKFSSPEVKHAAEVVGDIWLNDKNVFGGRKAIVSTSFGDAPAPMFADPPKCWLHKQGNFIVSFFPKDKPLKAGVDYDFFYLPPIDPTYGRPVEVGGDIWSMFKDRPEVRAVMEWFSRADHLKTWLASGGTIAPQKDVQLDWYGNDIDRGVAKILAGATSVRFDGSDLMPGEVGAGSFWKEMTAWIAGSEDLDTALKNIDASWPSK